MRSQPFLCSLLLWFFTIGTYLKSYLFLVRSLEQERIMKTFDMAKSEAFAGQMVNVLNGGAIAHSYQDFVG